MPNNKYYENLFNFMKSLGKFKQYKDYSDYCDKTDFGVAINHQPKLDLPAKPQTEPLKKDSTFKDYHKKEKCKKRHQEWLESLDVKERSEFLQLFEEIKK